MAGEEFDRQISIDNNGVLTTAEDHNISYEEGLEEVMLTTANRVFVHNPADEGGTFKLHEFDIATGTKVRTILTGVSLDDHMVASVVSNGNEVFVIIAAKAGGTNHVIQSFVL
jgi:hypothetical protein